MHRDPTPHTYMHRNRHSSRKRTKILPLTYEFTETIIPQVNAPQSYPSHMNEPNHSSNECTEIPPLTQECTETVIPQVNAPESYPSHMNESKSSLLRKMQWNSTPHTRMHRNRHPSGECTGILPLLHECTDIIIPQVNAQKSYPSHINAPKSYPSHMNAPKSSSLK